MADDRLTPVDRLPAAKPPRSAQAAPESREGAETDEQLKRSAVSALRKAGAQLRQPPPLPYPPRQETSKDSLAPPPASLPPPSADPNQAIINALRAEVEALRSGRKRTPERGIPAQGGHTSVDTTDSGHAPTKGDWSKLRYKVATAIVAALVLVIGALGLWAYTAISAKTEAIRAAQAAKAEQQTREGKWRQWASVAMWILDCRDRRDVATGEMLRPDLQKMGSARRLEAWRNDCPTELPPPP